MNRTIKFRAWDTVRSEYLSAGKVMIQILPGANPKDPEGLHLDTSSFLCAEGRMVLEQFTGLTDKNGVDIYESDVVQWTNTGDDSLDSGVIEWDDVYAGFGITGEHCLDWNHMLTIIGNVHENPELLKTNKIEE